jgi:hypothetical protein
MLLFLFFWIGMVVDFNCMHGIDGRRVVTNMTARQHRRAANHNLQTERADSRSPAFGGVKSLEGKAASLE